MPASFRPQRPGTLITYQGVLPYSQDWGVGFQIDAAAASHNFQALDSDVFGISQAQADQVKHFELQGRGDCRAKGITKTSANTGDQKTRDEDKTNGAPGAPHRTWRLRPLHHAYT